MSMFSPETERLRAVLAQQMTHTTGQSGGEWVQAKQRMNLLPPWYQTLSGERAGQGFTEALQAINQNRGDLQIGDTSINPIDFINPVAGIFGGKLAKTADLMALRDAMNRATAGEDARKIWQDTGWFKSPDGQWRFEIDDSGSMPGHKTYTWGTAEDAKVGNSITMQRQRALLHPQLSAAYPDSKRIGVTARLDAQGGSYDAEFDNIRAGYEQNGAVNRSTMLHELQHAIQQREGFARGGSPELMQRTRARAMEAVDAYNDRLRAISRRKDQVARNFEIPLDQRKAELEKLTIDYNAIMDEKLSMLNTTRDPVELYQRLAGEAEARAVQARMNLTPEQRRMRFPLDDYDVPVDELIYRYGQ